MTALKKFNVVDHLENDEAIIGYLDACLEEGGPALFLKALGDLVKAVGLTRIASAAGIASRTSAYRSFSENGNPTIATVDAVLAALGMRLAVVARNDDHQHA